MKLLQNIIAEHADELPFLWQRWQRALHCSRYSARELGELEMRMHAHLDGLRLGGAGAWDAINANYGWERAGELFSAGVLVFADNDAKRAETVFEKAQMSPTLGAGAASALAWLGYDIGARWLPGLANSTQPVRGWIALDVAAFHRVPMGNSLSRFLQHADPMLRARAFRAAGECGLLDVGSLCLREANQADTHCRFWAAWSALLLGQPQATSTLRAVLEKGEPEAARACNVLARVMSDANFRAWLNELAAQPATQRFAIQAAGARGSASLVPWIIQAMVVPQLARVAGEAFTSITGADLLWEQLQTTAPADLVAGPNDDPDDDHVAMDPDELLIWPNVNKVAQWWRQNEARFDPAQRYLRGQIINETSLPNILRVGDQVQRAAAALEWVLRKPGTPLPQIGAPLHWYSAQRASATAA